VSLTSLLAVLGTLGALLTSALSLYLVRQNKRLLSAQASKTEAEGGATMISSAIALTKALREEEEACRKRLAELSGKQEEGAKERMELRAKITEMDRQIIWLTRLLQEAGLDETGARRVEPCG